MNKKKIIIINQYGVTPDVPGATKHYEMAKYFSRKNDFNIEYWLSGLNHKTGKNHNSIKVFKLQSKKIENNNFNIVRFKGFAYGENLIIRQLSIIWFDFLTSIRILFSKNIDTVILNTPPLSILNVIFIKIKGIQLIIDVEDLWPLFLVDMGLKNKFAIKYMEYLSKFAYRHADKISTVSEGMLRYVAEIKGNNNNLWLSPLGVNVKEYTDTQKNSDLISNKAWRNDFIVMYIGAMGKANDIVSVINTIVEYNKIQNTVNNKKVSFVFIGDGDQKKRIIEYASKYEIDNLYFEDAVSGEQVAEYLIHANICLTNLLKIESFKLVRPNKLFQYMALGKPIISGIWGEFQDIITQENTGIYVDFTKSENAALLIKEFLNDTDRQKVMTINGPKYTNIEGNRDLIFEKYYKMIKLEKI